MSTVETLDFKSIQSKLLPDNKVEKIRLILLQCVNGTRVQNDIVMISAEDDEMNIVTVNSQGLSNTIM